MKGKHLFILDAAILRAVTDDEIAATITALKTLGLYRLPYDHVSVRLPTDACSGLPYDIPAKFPDLTWRYDENGKVRTNFGPAHWTQLDNLNLKGEPSSGYFCCEGDHRFRPYHIPMPWYCVASADQIIDLLITVLATRNAVKSLVRNKCARLGIGGKRPGSIRAFEYVTTISVPAELVEDHDSVRPGAAKAPHLRRGHIRNQHYGPANTYTKQVWIEPTFINADKDFVSTRKAYNLGGQRPRKESAA